MNPPNTQRLRLSGGSELAFFTAGDPSKPAVLLLHGLPNSSRMFRATVPVLAEVAFLVAPDLPGFGESDLLPVTSFRAYADAIEELLQLLDIGPRYLFVHDFGAPVALQIAVDAPELVRGLIVQNANAHRSGMASQWRNTYAYWADPNPETEAAATAHLSFEGTRAQYLDGVPEEITANIAPETWIEDWRVMCLPGRMQMQRDLLLDYAGYVARFGAIADYLTREQPPALMILGRHDIYFEIAETLSWMQDLPRMEAHVLDAGHLLLETNAVDAAALMAVFVARH
jgi:pimeloyl-ACP methyl ester carboxylesterase